VAAIPTARRAALRAARENEATIAVAQVIEELRPFIAKVKDQSKRHMATVSFTELKIIVSGLERLLTRWADGDGSSDRFVTPRKPRRPDVPELI